MRKLFRWLIDKDQDELCSAIDIELDAYANREPDSDGWVEALHHHLNDDTGKVVTTPFRIYRGPRS